MTNRKKDHLELAEKAQKANGEHSIMSSVFYEPLFATHPSSKDVKAVQYKFLNYNFEMPFWVSSMTGGEDSAFKVNSELARMSESLGLGLGLGSCRIYIEDESRRQDFHVKEFMPNQCLATNLGIAQVEQYLEAGRWQEIEEKLSKINADFLFVHINPLQEWLQPEGDLYQVSPIETLEKLKQIYTGKLGVKEVGQGFGPKSLRALIDLEVDVIEIAGNGGTNFTKLERLRTNGAAQSHFESIGHHWSEMLPWLNELYLERQNNFPEIIISGGVRSAVEAAKISLEAKCPHLIGMGYTFLKWQRMGEDHMEKQVKKFYQDYLFALNILDKEK